MSSYYDAIFDALMEPQPDEKIAKVERLFQAGALPNGVPSESVQRVIAAGQPTTPVLIDPRLVPIRKLGSAEGRAALCHAVAHIEFNAINLALDACYRFRDMPAQYYADWLSVAHDEARHFSLLATRLNELDSHYGAFDAHNGLWEMALRTDHDALTRMALVPRVLEARGLDVTPGMIKRLSGVGDRETVEVLEVILREEVRHVDIGSYWFAVLCEQQGHDPEQRFEQLLDEYSIAIKLPINTLARLKAGFSQDELTRLERR